MFGKTNQPESVERLDQLGRAIVVRAAASNEAQAEAVAASPFLYARLRTRIAAEQAGREGGSETWRALLGGVWRSAVPAMALVAVFALVLFWTSSLGTSSAPGVLSDEALLDPGDAGIENVVFAERRALSSDDVLATIISEDERGEVSR